MLKKIILWTLTILWAIMVFCFSHQSAEESKELSSLITNKVVESLPGSDTMSKEDKEDIHEVIRKLAHFGLYTGFGVLLTALFSVYGVPLADSVLLVLAVGFLYAVSDEIHQRFISERSCEARDVFIDTAGTSTGWFLFFASSLIKNRWQRQV